MGETFRTFYSGVFPYDGIGIVTGTVGSTNFPNIGCGVVRFKAFSTNTGTFLLCTASGTAAQGYPLRASEDTGWVATDSLSRYWYKDASGTSDKVSYWYQK